MLDKDFLKELDQIPLKEIYAEIIALNDRDEVLESIEGRVTQGSVNIDGASSVRRTCSLTIVANELNIHKYYWGLHTKFKLALGVKNTINNKYPDVIWFKQGIFVISSFTTTQSTNSYTISIQGRDKMSKLNGEFGGLITALTEDFGKVLEIDDAGFTVERKISLKEIITNAVHYYANEPFHNIIVNDLDETGLELLEYQGDKYLYLTYYGDTEEANNLLYSLQAPIYGNDGKVYENFEDIPKDGGFKDLSDLVDSNAIVFYASEADRDADRNPFQIARIERGQTAGYRITDLVYAGDLIMKIGDSITTMLDKIVTMLGEYEYFYDINGRFIFQRKKTYMVNSWSTIKRTLEDETYVDNAAYTSAISYSFEDGKLISSYSNNPNYSNIKNDFTVWGVRKSSSGSEIPIHMRYAIDEKPWIYVSYKGDYYTTLTAEELFQKIKQVPEVTNKMYESLEWRELIYQMALDYNANHLEDDFFLTIEKNNFGKYHGGVTGYEQYYTDLTGFWRDIYDPNYIFHFENVSISKAEYENAYTHFCGPDNKDLEFKYYYSVPYYQKCSKDQKYSDKITYYAYRADEEKNKKRMEKVNLTEDEYNGEWREQYYIIKENEPTEIVNTIILEPYEYNGEQYYTVSNGIYELTSEIKEHQYYLPIQCTNKEEFDKFERYYIRNGENNFILADNISKELFDSNKTNYYYLSLTTPTELAKTLYFIESYDYLPCAKTEDYVEGGQDYYAETGVLLPTVKKEDYEASPKDYWRKNYIYFQCDKDISYIPGEKYYAVNSTAVSDKDRYVEVKIMNQDIYTKAPDKYYLRLLEIPKSTGAFNSAEKYYLITSTLVNISEEDYNNPEKRLNYYRINKDGVFYQCANEEYDDSVNYYTITLEPRAKLTSKAFEENKEKYYTLYSAEYTKQTSSSVFNPEVVYYTEEFKPDRPLSSKIFEANVGKYYTKEIDTYKSCLTNEEFSQDRNYYLNLWTYQKDLKAENFIDRTKYRYPVKRYIQCSGNSQFNPNFTYYRSDGDYKSCLAFNLPYDPNAEYYVSNRSAYGGFKNAGDKTVTYTKLTMDDDKKEAYYNNPVNKKYLYVKRILYANCADANIGYRQDRKYYTRSVTDSSNTPWTSNDYTRDDAQQFYTYTEVSNLSESVYNSNRGNYYVRTNNYTPIPRGEMKATTLGRDPESYYTYATVCIPCGELVRCGDSDEYSGQLVYYILEDGKYKVASGIDSENFAEKKSTLYYGREIDGIDFVAGRTCYVLSNGVYVAVNGLRKSDYDKDVSKYYIQYQLNCKSDDMFASDLSYYALQHVRVENLKPEVYEETITQYKYVDKWKYVQCSANSKFSASENYYSKVQTPIYDLDEETFNADKTKYYIRREDTLIYKQCRDYHQCASDAEYNNEETYYSLVDGKYEAQNIDKTAFEAISDKSVFYTYKKEYYSSDAIYYVLINGEYMPKTELDEKEYNKYPNKYFVKHQRGELYRCVEVIRNFDKKAIYGYRIFYKQCTTDDTFDAKKSYYIFENEEYKAVKIIEEQFNENKANYWYALTSVTYEDYTNDGPTTDPMFKSMALEGNLYHKYPNYEKCVRPVDYSTSIFFYVKKDDMYDKENKWHKNVKYNPELLNFWFDFIGEDSELQKFGCHAIGNRPKGVNDNQVKAIYFRETPTVIFVNSKDWVDKKVDKTKLGYTYIQLNDEVEPYFSVSSQGKSAKTAVDNLVYEHACGAEQITISVLPIYHLEPNTRIFIRNDESGINGEYILVRYNLTLGTNGTMSITASKAVDKLY